MTDEATDNDVDRTASGVSDGLSRLFPDASISNVFSKPEQIGDEVVITAAAWERAGGFGLGGGGGSKGDDEHGFGTGGGGGGMSQGRPVAVIRVNEQGVKVAPVIDFTKIGVTLLLTALGVWRVLK